jgi:hemolysin activation/secretion protein
MLCVCTGVAAQERLGVEQAPRPGTPPLPQLEERPSQPPPGPVLPPVPPPAEKTEPFALPRVFVREIRVTGNTVFTAEELAAVTAPYANRALTAEDLEEVRLALTRFYVEHGYITSGAIIPDQTVTEGVVTFHIIEGQLSHIEVEGNKWFRAGYLRRRLALGAGLPVNILAVQQRLQFLQQDERIERINAELRPGVQLGESVLNVRVAEAFPLHVALEFNNYQAPTIGAERGLVTLSHENLTGHGDILSATYGYSSGLDLQIDASYSLPLTARDTTLFLRYRRDATVVVEEPFKDLDITSESDIYTISLRHPLYRTLSQEFAMALTGEYERNETFLLGDRFAFAPGTEEGKSTITAVRLSLEWTDRTQNQVVAARSRFTIGVNAFGATIHSSRSDPDGEFFAWLGQFQWARRLTAWDLQLLWRLDVQLATDPLLPLEQLAVGGRYSVRGYRENQLVRDNGLIVSLESRIPLVRNKPWADFVHLAPFVDFGHAWNNVLPTPDPQTIASLGVGLRWALTLTSPIRLRPQFEVYWGYPLKQVDTTGGNLQDLGIHLQFVVVAF